MVNILVSLVSKQTIPNILLIKELADIDRHILITTAETEKEGWTDWIVNVCGLADKHQRIQVPADDPRLDTLLKEKVKPSDDDQFIVNLTGGTKMMSISIYNFFVRRQTKIIYLPFGRNEYVQVLPEIEHRIIPIAYRLNLREYLASYNVRIINDKKINKLLFDPKKTDYTTRFLNKYLQCSAAELQLLDALRSFRSKGVRFDPDELKEAQCSADELVSFLDRLEFPMQNREKLSKYEVRYLTGEWLEEYAYSLIKENLGLQEENIGLGVHIEKNETQNEVDIFFVRDNAIYFIECKTGLFDKISDKDILTETLYKIQALQKDFGLSIKSYIFTLTPADKIKKADIKRSKSFNIKVFFREVLSGSDFEWLRSAM
ncbi:MAG: DUF1887 family protein [Gammaproteobacteria bacterium]|nr:DUF1887 family protein [Gammaproteobacteria bacterium]